jgi:chromate transport protein ChrA
VGVALVASAAKGMASKLCATPLTAIISTGATVGAYYWPKAYTFPVLIALGGIITTAWSYYKKETLPPVKVRAAHLNLWWVGHEVLLLVLLVVMLTVWILYRSYGGQHDGCFTPPPTSANKHVYTVWNCMTVMKFWTELRACVHQCVPCVCYRPTTPL